VNYRQPALAIVASLFVSLALADDIKTKDGKEANRSDAAGPNSSASNAQQPNRDDTVRVGLEYYSPEEQAADTRHAAKQEEFSPKEEKAALAKIPAGGTCDVELYADSLEAADPKRLTYVIFNSTGKEIDRRKGKSILAPRSSVSYWWKGGDQIDLPAIQNSLRLRIYDELRGQTIGEYVFRPKKEPDRVCCDKFLPPSGERGVRSKILQ
jgi:hypothetical protein